MILCLATAEKYQATSKIHVATVEVYYIKQRIHVATVEVFHITTGKHVATVKANQIKTGILQLASAEVYQKGAHNENGKKGYELFEKYPLRK